MQALLRILAGVLYRHVSGVTDIRCGRVEFILHHDGGQQPAKDRGCLRPMTTGRAAIITTLIKKCSN